jgi:predicted Zn-dependent peptidase
VAISIGSQRAGSTRTLTKAQDGSTTKRSVLPGGLRVITEHIPTARSVAIGFWVGVGSRDETPRTAGASHFLEHLLFKGTQKRGPFEIAAEIEEVGGDLNAFTTKECTCYHARVLADDLPIAVDVLADMVTSCLIEPADVDSEREVVIEELAMNEDDHADTAHQRLTSMMFGGCTLADPIIGTVDSLRAMTRANIWRHYRRHYRSNEVVITAAGAVSHTQLLREVRRATARWAKTGTIQPLAARAARDGRGRLRKTGECDVISRPTEQAHIMLGLPGFSRTDDRRWALALLDTALGSGMSSRLFQEVREKRGLVYTVQSFRSAYSDVGAFGVYAGTMPDKADTTVAVISEVLADVLTNGLTDAELVRAKGQLRGSAVLDAEDNLSRMSRLGDAEVLTGVYRTLDDTLEMIDDVSMDDVRDVATDVLAHRPSLVVVGPYEEDRVFDALSPKEFA